MKNMAGREAGYSGHITRENTLTRSQSACLIEHSWSSNISSIQENNHKKTDSPAPFLPDTLERVSHLPGNVSDFPRTWGETGAQLQPPESRKGIANIPLHSLTLLGIEPACMASLRVFRTWLPWTDFPVCYFN